MAVGDRIVEVDGFLVSEATLLTYILGADRPDSFVSIKVMCECVLGFRV